LKLPIPATPYYAFLKGRAGHTRNMILGIRPEHVVLVTGEIKGDAEWTVDAIVEVIELMGADLYVYVAMGDYKVIARTDAQTPVQTGDRVKVEFQMNKVHFFDPNTGLSIRNQGDVGEC